MTGSSAAWPPTSRRQRWIGVLARSPRQTLARAVAALDPVPGYTLLRAPEPGLVMVRGRAGGDGERFNLGEMTVTRAAVRLASGAIGFAWVAGRDRQHAELAALLDACLCDARRGPALEAAVVEPLAEAIQARADALCARAAATRVDVLTLATGREVS